jgi:hypothetical protein
MTTQSQLLLDVRSRLDEQSPQFYSDGELRRWINQGARDVARRTETLQTTAVINLAPGQQQYTAPPDTLRIYRVEFQDSTSRIYVLEYRDYNNADSVWWTTQLTTQSNPNMWTAWGFPPNLKIVLYPIPANPGTSIKVFYYQSPADLAIDGTASNSTIPIPTGREELIADFTEYMALRKARDPRWQEAKALYDEKVQSMIDQTRRWSDQAGTYDTDGYPLHPFVWDEGWA